MKSSLSALSMAKTEHGQKCVSSSRVPASGRLEDAPGNPIENRLIGEFFIK